MCDILLVLQIVLLMSSCRLAFSYAIGLFFFPSNFNNNIFIHHFAFAVLSDAVFLAVLSVEVPAAAVAFAACNPFI